MNTSALAVKPVRTIREWKRTLPTVEQLSISVMASVHADRHRIYQALTVPEYIETWFSAPGAVTGCTEVFVQEDFFSIGYSRKVGERCGILCSYKVRRRNKLLFTWEHNAFSESPSSMVKIRLLGDFERTTVHVTHVGLTLADQQWHQDLWESSLRSLGKLF
jgi:uncharacterized protein YndB with AHSA1/START domain